jgi:extradiol dioxygenase family protein
MQAAEAMLKSDFNTLHMDGTKRSGNEFDVFGVQIGTSTDQSLIIMMYTHPLQYHCISHYDKY